MHKLLKEELEPMQEWIDQLENSANTQKWSHTWASVHEYEDSSNEEKEYVRHPRDNRSGVGRESDSIKEIKHKIPSVQGKLDLETY